MKIINVTFDSSMIVERFKYAIHFLNRHPYSIGKVCFKLILEGKGDLHYGIKPRESGFFVPQQGYFFTERYQFEKPLFLNTFEFENDTYYSVEEKSKALNSLISDFQFNFDLFETIFFHLARVEERMYPIEQLTETGLMPENDLMVIKSGIHFKPIVDELLKAFFTVIGVEINKTKLTKIITHDIDLVGKYQNSTNVLHSLGSTLKRSYSLRKIAKFGKDYIMSRIGMMGEPYFDLRLLSTSEGIQKIIYLYIGGKHKFDFPRSEKRNNYLKNWAKQAKARGYKLGFHPSFEAATNLELFAEEIKILEGIIEENVIYSRQHYLHFSHQKTMKILQSNGIEHDSTFGFNRHFGFKVGTSYQYHLYDWANESLSDVAELPLSWMDSAMWHWSGKQASVFKEESYKFFSTLTEGDICINIHNNSIYDFEMYGINLVELKTKFESNG